MDRFLVHDAGRSGDARALHALVIGVGDYPHLLGGSGGRTESHDGMRQLTSPPVSARALTDWLCSKFHNPEFKRMTVSLLLSEPDGGNYRNPKTGDEHEVEVATFDNIKQAVREWKDRGDKHIDDMLMFYFCGHGISDGLSMVILPSDFGSDDENAFSTAIDFRKFYDAMVQYKARRQWFIVDACRSSSDSLKGNTAQQILQFRPRDAEGIRIAPVFYSTLGGEKAHGRPDQPSVYTDVLIRCLDGMAAEDSRGDWRVTNLSLLPAIGHLVSRVLDPNMRPVQIPQGNVVLEPHDFHMLSDDPASELYVVAEPPDFLPKARLECLADEDALLHSRDPEDGDEWALELTTGRHRIRASIEGEPDLKAEELRWVRPPFARVTLEFEE